MKTRLYVAAVLGGLALLAATVVVVFAFGRHNPSPPSLEDNPRTEIPGELLYINQDYCFVTAAASGSERAALACMPRYFTGPRLYWVDDNTAGVIQYDQRGAVLWHVDLRTGAMTDTGKVIGSFSIEKPSPPGLYGGAYAPDGTFASVDQDGALYFVRDGVRKKITNFDSPEHGQPQVLLWSPDGQWLVLQYYPPRAGGPEIWIVSRDGATQGTLAKDVAPGPGSAAWRIGLQSEPKLPQ